ncbi:hypothetical protein K491DRAFT_711439 [Lophiostoma macrostomum CBS 122681]|uniref:Uncharacterized protein n=1 Tax=Lophiostoma macrostomum CBS 122681 TaxID=1314788 RepID=A0A6A6TLA5_9PLEO|nr:hypothetical protein K491DRAFT_711439 [Lophiostoma macrostomum CBS 122681]
MGHPSSTPSGGGALEPVMGVDTRLPPCTAFALATLLYHNIRLPSYSTPEAVSLLQKFEVSVTVKVLDFFSDVMSHLPSSSLASRIMLAYEDTFNDGFTPFPMEEEIPGGEDLGLYQPGDLSQLLPAADNLLVPFPDNRFLEHNDADSLEQIRPGDDTALLPVDGNAFAVEGDAFPEEEMSEKMLIVPRYKSVLTTTFHCFLRRRVTQLSLARTTAVNSSRGMRSRTNTL